MTDFGEPYVDVDEWRDAPVRHRYVHGGFAGTETRFSIYLPPAERYEGRFFQHITPVPDSEHLAQAATGERGQDRVLDRQRRLLPRDERRRGRRAARAPSVDPTIAAYRANAAAAQHSRVVAAEMYGEHRPYGYAYGGSGGGYRTIGGAENTTGVWDGVRPVRHRLADGDPEHVHRPHARAAGAATPLRPDRRRGRAGRQRRHVRGPRRRGARRAHRGDPDGVPAALVVRPPHDGHARLPGPLPGRASWPTRRYFEDFWTEPGYLGHAAPALAPAGHRAAPVRGGGDDHRSRRPRSSASTVGRQPGQARGGVDTAWRGPTAVRRRSPSRSASSTAPAVDILGAELIVTSGAAAGRTAPRAPRRRTTSRCSARPIPTSWRSCEPGDAVEVDNRGLPRRADLPPPPGARAATSPSGTSSATPDGTPHLPPAPAAARAAVRGGRRRDGADRPLRREDDRRRVACSTGRRSRGRPTGTAPRSQEHLGERHRRPLPALVRRQRPARRRRDPGEPDPHRQLPRRAAPGAPRRERLGGAGRRPAVEHDATRSSTARSSCRPRRRERRRRPAGGRRSPSTAATGPTWRSATR